MVGLLMFSLYFYPRSPCGERLWVLRKVPILSIFLSTLSLRRATHKTPELIINVRFLSTLSLRRATFSAGRESDTEENFYPRSPCGERPASHLSKFNTSQISIHALLAESDRLGAVQNTKIDISIHALLAESDRTQSQSLSA